MNLPDLLDLLASLSFRNCANERDMQDTIQHAFDGRTIAHQRELRIAGGRIDFVVGAVGAPHRIGVECKVKGSLTALTRQVSAYTDEATVHELVIVTTERKHALVPQEMSGKRVHVCWVGGSRL